MIQTIILTESLLDSTWEKPGQPSNHCYVWSTCELIIEVLKCKVSLLRITNMPLTPWDLRFFRKTKSCFLSSTFFCFVFLQLRLEDSIVLDPNLKALFTHARNMKNKFMFIYTDDVGVSVLILFIDYCHKRAYYTYIGNYNTVISSHNEKIIVKLADGIFHRYFIPIINRVWMGFYASVDSNSALPPAPRPAPRATAGHLSALAVPGVWLSLILLDPGAGH